jgi:hypothetical protein
MLTAFIMVVLGMLIIWIIDQYAVIMFRIWLMLGDNLFQYTVIHSDDESGNFYALTFTDDEHWDKKCLKDLNDHFRSCDKEDV